MKFEMWSIWHFVYMISPFIVFLLLYLVTCKKSEKVKNITGIILGAVSLLILIVRNVDIYLRNGMDLEVIPLQVCHVGSIVTGLALMLRKRWLLITAFCFNMIPAFLAMIFANSLENYSELLRIRPQTYIWGHIFIVVCSLYGVFIYKPKATKKDLIYSLSTIFSILIVAIVCNSALRLIPEWEPNYFYLYNYKGTPLKFLYNAFPVTNWGWFSINFLYVIILVLVFIVVYFALLYLTKLIAKKLK